MADVMHALRAYTDGVDGLRYEEAPVPVPALDEVLVQVRAASFTPTELTWPSTSTDRTGRSRLPAIPSHEVCGTVVGLGYGAAGWRVGDDVYGMCDWYRDGAAAEFVAVEARNLAPSPRSCSPTDAASVPLAGLTVLQALEHGHAKAGETVLVTGAAGGVGSLAVQLARHLGARVIGAGRAHQEAAVRELGAEGFVDLDRDGWADALADVDLVFDLVGGRVLEHVRGAPHVPERIVSAAEPADGVVFFVVEPDRSALANLARMIDAGDIRPVVGAVTPLAGAADAFAAKHGVTGKSVLQVS